MIPEWLQEHLNERIKLLTPKAQRVPWDELSQGGLAELLAIRRLIEDQGASSGQSTVGVGGKPGGPGTAGAPKDGSSIGGNGTGKSGGVGFDGNAGAPGKPGTARPGGLMGGNGTG
jgi:hypothetical protein